MYRSKIFFQMNELLHLLIAVDMIIQDQIFSQKRNLLCSASVYLQLANYVHFPSKGSRAAAPLCRKEPLEVVGHLIGIHPLEVVQTGPSGRRPRGRPTSHWRDYISHVAW